MLGILSREFQSLFKSIKSIIFILIMFSVTLLVASLLKGAESQLSEVGLSNSYVAGLFLIILIFGPLFVITLSHDSINRESHGRTLRFLLPKISRNKIILGKVSGITLFWILCLTIAIILVSFVSKVFYFKELIESIIFLSYFISFSLFLSVLIRKPSMSMFMGILLSLAIPIVGIWGITNNPNFIVKLLSFLTPYYYFGQPEQRYLIYFVPVLSVIWLFLSLILFKKRDY
ncbi:ABC transporter permease subunit [Bacillus siamensis]|uniref:ABC transporter permease n=1 Tax=Bacillus siamensis TaxID=659243 RepID=UPI002E1C9263|nr:ABC transporter permease subunit [Bacillus siamensis]MED5049254.1 ABC transporter permease subunit [Bacillus siamensis]MED5097493.1 ABC transporter permease subunit [Bacillus siamensis]